MKMEIHIGGNSALYGDGSIGGSIQLTTKAKWDKGIHGDVILSAGSFKSFFEGVTLRYSGKTLESRTSILQSSALNNYSFINNTSPGRPKEYLNNSAYSNYGILQEVYKKFRNTGNLSATLLYLDFHRQIQPSVSSNNRPDSYGSISDKNLKIDMKYNVAKEHLSYAAGISYAYDIQKYQQDIIATNRLTGTLNGEYRLNKLIIKAGASAEYIKPDVYSYADSIIENRLNLYALLRYVPYSKLFLSAGLRYAHITNADVPLMPSLDAKYLILSNYNHNLSLRASVSQNSKVPHPQR